MSTADYIILGIATYVAVMSLVRLMRQRQRQVMQELAGQVRRQQSSAKPKSPPPGQETATSERRAA